MSDVLNKTQFPPLYHGSDHDIEVGDVVRPGARPSNYPQHWGTSGYAFATASPGEAMLHGRNRYAVEPVDADDVQPDDREPHALASRAGFRVVSHLDTDDLKEHVARYRERATS